MRRLFLHLIAAVAVTASASDLDREALALARNSYLLEAERANAEAEKAAARAENVLEGPEAEFEYKFAPAGEKDRWGFSIGQSFEFPGVYGARRRANRLREGAFEQLYRRDLLDKTYEAKLALIRYYEAQEVLEVIKTAYANTDSLAVRYRQALERGETTILEVKKIEIQLFDMHRRMTDASNELDAALAALEVLSGKGETHVPAARPLEAPELMSLEHYRSGMVENNPELAYNSLMSDVENAGMKVARMSSLPSFRLAYVHDFEENMHFNGFGVGITLPSWSSRSKTAEARARAFAAEQILEDSRVRAAAELSSAYAAASRLRKVYDESSRLVSADDYGHYLKVALDAGRITLFTYFTEYNDYLDAKLSLISLKGDYVRAEAALSKYSTDINAE